MNEFDSNRSRQLWLNVLLTDVGELTGMKNKSVSSNARFRPTVFLRRAPLISWELPSLLERGLVTWSRVWGDQSDV